MKQASLVAQLVKNLPATQERHGLGKIPGGTHSSILAWRIPWTEDPGGVQSLGSRESHGL